MKYKMTPHFWKGYKAWVNGGRICRSIKNGNTEYYDGWQPFDDMTDAQKADWFNGIEYAKAEREACLKLNATQVHRPHIHHRKYRRHNEPVACFNNV